MGFVGLLQPKRNPDPDAERVASKKQNTADSGELVADDLFDRVGVLGSKSDSATELVVLFVNFLVDPLAVSKAVGPVETQVIEDMRC